MRTKLVWILLLGLSFGATAFAADPANDAQITLKGVLHEDKNGFFMTVDGTTYDLRFNDDGKGDMHKFYTSLEGDMVKIQGKLETIQEKDQKPALVVYTTDITRLKGERPVVVETRETVVERPVVREYYVEHERRRGIHLPGIHINW